MVYVNILIFNKLWVNPKDVRVLILVALYAEENIFVNFSQELIKEST